MIHQPINPPARLLMGPGPINADPRVLRAMSAPLVGQFDPVMTGYMNATQELYRYVFATANEATALVDGTSRAGIEAVLVSLLEPGDRVVVPVFGRFGYLLKEIAERCGAEVHVCAAPWGQVVPANVIEAAVASVRPRLVAVVHGDTSTTMMQPIQEIGQICARYGALSYADVTASLGGNQVDIDAWGLDAASAGLQKCLGGSSGSAPFTLSEAAVRAIRQRASTEEGIRDDGEAPSARRIASNYFDLDMILDYWGPRRLNHHTESTTMLYGAYECARLIEEEGRQAVIERHRLHGQAMAAALTAMGLRLFGDSEHRMNNVVAVQIPDAVNGQAVRAELLNDYGIEIGTSFGPLAGRVWRIGTMGVNARQDAVLTTVAALEQVLRRAGAAVRLGAGIDGAMESYQASAQ